MISDFTQTEIGFYKKTNKHIVFFGNKNSSEESIQKFFPDLELRHIKQVHGDKCVLSSQQLAEADAHWTQEKNKALLIKTADCIPLFLISENKALAIHAGWRGVANKITEKAISQLSLQAYKAYIGPHISKNSFETKEDCYKIFSQLSEHKNSFVVKKESSYFIDLAAYLQTQLKNHATTKPLNVDTVTNTEFHSYRRDKASSGRNISFCALL